MHTLPAPSSYVLPPAAPFPRNPVYELQPHEHERCYACEREGNARLYGRGEAYLTGPDHTPHDDEAHIFCARHLDPGSTVMEGIEVN